MKRNSGITLIALVITIVVLIILASVAITLSLGNNGVFKKATKAKEDTLVAQNEERVQLAEATNSIDEITSSTRLENQSNSQTKKDELWTGDISKEGEAATLNTNIENYDFILLESRWSDTTSTMNTVLNVDSIKSAGYFLTNYAWPNNHARISMVDNFYIYISFTSNKSLIISQAALSETQKNVNHLSKVIGIKM